MSRSVTMGPVAAGLRHPGLLVHRSPVAKMPVSQTVRFYATPGKGGLYSQSSVVRRIMGEQSSNKTKEMRMSEGIERSNDMFKHGNGPLYPGTFISLPLSRYPKSPRAFLTYSWFRLQTWGLEIMALLKFKLQSMPNYTSRPLWKAQRGKIPPTAKAMYQEVLEAFAAGDKATVEKLCQPSFASKLAAAMERRSPKEVMNFEVVKYNRPRPRVVAYQIQPSLAQSGNMIEQATVAIASTQKVFKTDATTGRTIDGTLRIQKKVENVVLAREVNPTTFQPGKWRVWGTTSTTDLEQYKTEQRIIQRQMARHLGMDKPAK